MLAFSSRRPRGHPIRNGNVSSGVGAMVINHYFENYQSARGEREVVNATTFFHGVRQVE